MAGILINVLPKTDFTFSTVGVAAIETTIARSLNVIPYREGVLIARVHSKSAASNTQTLSVVVREVAPTSEDPAADFSGTTAIATAPFTISGGTTGAQTPVFIPLTAPLPPFVRVLLQASQTTPLQTFTCSVSVDLVVRE